MRRSGPVHHRDTPPESDEPIPGVVGDELAESGRSQDDARLSPSGKLGPATVHVRSLRRALSAPPALAVAFMLEPSISLVEIGSVRTFDAMTA